MKTHRSSARKHPTARWEIGSRTVPGKGYFAILRLYGPTEAGLDKGWKPADIVKME